VTGGWLIWALGMGLLALALLSAGVF